MSRTLLRLSVIPGVYIYICVELILVKEYYCDIKFQQ